MYLTDNTLALRHSLHILLQSLIFILISSNLPAGLFNDDDQEKIEDFSLTQSESAEVDALSHYAWGYYLELDENTSVEAVIDEYLSSLRNDPNSDFLVKEILDVFWSQDNAAQQHDLIIKHLVELAEKNPESVELNLIVARAHMNEHDFGAARRMLLNLFKRVKWTEPRLIEELANCYQGTGDFRRTHRLFKKATSPKRLRGNYTVEYSAAVFYDSVANSDEYRLSGRQRDEFQRLAYSHALRAVKSFGNDPSASAENNEEMMALVTLLLTGNLVEPVINLLTTLHREGYVNENSNRLLAECYESVQQFESAYEIWKLLSDDAPFNAGYHFRVGRVLKLLHRYNDSLFAYESAFRLSPIPQFAFEISLLYLHLNAPEKALKYSLLAPSESLETYLLRSHIYRRLNQFNDALTVLESVQQSAAALSNPDFLTVDYFIALATVHHLLENKAETVKALDQALEIEPINPEANNFLGYYLADENEDLSRAKQYINVALKQDPENPAYVDSLAWVLYRQGKYRAAELAIVKALTLQPDDQDAAILDHAGDIYYSLGNPTKAIAYWKKALLNNIEKPERVTQKIINAGNGSVESPAEIKDDP
jgi:tetratricopeptide (TPR) repeat protein